VQSRNTGMMGEWKDGKTRSQRSEPRSLRAPEPQRTAGMMESLKSLKPFKSFKEKKGGKDGAPGKESRNTALEHVEFG